MPSNSIAAQLFTNQVSASFLYRFLLITVWRYALLQRNVSIFRLIFFDRRRFRVAWRRERRASVLQYTGSNRILLHKYPYCVAIRLNKSHSAPALYQKISPLIPPYHFNTSISYFQVLTIHRVFGCWTAVWKLFAVESFCIWLVRRTKGETLVPFS